jgi:methylenetetrahydrofolate dehydrogenase (NADP+) / methenyltetrahydrofolate cyclohydrolase / formyltetrahydrofolate synthetase
LTLLVASTTLSQSHSIRATRLTKMSAPFKLELMNPVPSDIEVSQSIKTIPIGEVAEAVGVLPAEYDLYGRNKLKVSLDVRERLKARYNYAEKPEPLRYCVKRLFI